MNLTSVREMQRVYDNFQFANRFITPSYISSITEQLKALKAVQQSYADVFSAVDITELAASYQSVFQASKSAAEILDTFNHSNFFEQYNSILHPSWKELVEIPASSAFGTAAIASLKEFYRTSLLTEQLIKDIDFTTLSSAYTEFERNLNHLTISYHSLAESVADVQKLVTLPAFLLPDASREVYLSTRVLSSATETDSEECEKLLAEIRLETNECMATLGRVDPKFQTLLQGAREALTGKNTKVLRFMTASPVYSSPV